MKLFKITIALICILFAGKATSQSVWENHTSEVYNYLSRMAQKGLIVFDDNIRPLSRTYLAASLDSLRSKTGLLTMTEKKELTFYQQEFSDLMPYDSSSQAARFLKKDDYHRWRTFAARGKDASLFIDPVITAATIHGSGKDYSRTSSGLKFWGYLGKHWGYQFFYDDITESGKGFDTTRRFTPETGMVRKDTSLYTSQNYSVFRGSISYSWHNGSISFGQDHLLWGYGENGRIVLSDKAPAYPYLRIDYQPFPWLRLNYTHGWLSSNIIDSNRTYHTGNTAYNGERLLFVPKFFATHSAQIKLSKGLHIAVGESIIYSDRMDAGYLIPVMFFKIYDNIVSNGYIQAGSNGQVFLQVSSRNQVPKTHLYGTLFIDEIRIDGIFDKNKQRNQLGYTLGAATTDIGLRYLTAAVEYTRINPFVYANLIPAQTYTSHGYSLGDWMGNNFDRFIFSLQYTPAPRLKCAMRYQYSRKGAAGTVEQQYFQQPQPPFLFDLQNTQQELFASASYEWINNLTIHAWANRITTHYPPTNRQTAVNTFSIGIAYGL